MSKYGYPECCIRWFTEERIFKKKLLLTYLQIKYAYDGFIPCEECAIKLQKENKLLYELIDNDKRDSNIPLFPIVEPYSDDEIKNKLEYSYSFIRIKH
jgi:hypothetical protein